MLKKNPSFRALLLGTALTTLSLASCGDKKTDTHSAPATQNTTGAPGTAAGGRIAYVNIDTLQEKYEYFRVKKAEMEKKAASLDAEVERMAQNLQNEYTAFQKKAQAGTLTQTEGEAGQRKLQQLQQNIENRRQTLGAQLMKEQEAFNKDLKKRLDNYLIKYNADKGYDYILSYAEGGSILFANKALDITEDVVKGMNADAANGATETGTSEKK